MNVILLTMQLMYLTLNISLVLNVASVLTLACFTINGNENMAFSACFVFALTLMRKLLQI